MTTDEVYEAFERLNDEFLKFSRIENPRHPRPDICAFLMLHDLAPCTSDGNSMTGIVSAAEHDQIWLGTDTEVFAAVATDDIIRDLLRCGVLWDDDTEGLFMFV